MRALRFPAVVLVALLRCGFDGGQDLTRIQHLWQQTLNALRAGKTDEAQAGFGEFNQGVRQYVDYYRPLGGQFSDAPTDERRERQIRRVLGHRQEASDEVHALAATVLNDTLTRALRLLRVEDNKAL